MNKGILTGFETLLGYGTEQVPAILAGTVEAPYLDTQTPDWNELCPLVAFEQSIFSPQLPSSAHDMIALYISKDDRLFASICNIGSHLLDGDAALDEHACKPIQIGVLPPKTSLFMMATTQLMIREFGNNSDFCMILLACIYFISTTDEGRKMAFSLTDDNRDAAAKSVINVIRKGQAAKALATPEK